ncbi:hypothetical protein niasHS_004653 [Heterodera schachtii]|uniref:TIL domain-containing protein n=1 Tax=Heterodera schachtii TaxID=97005 RepID=A0ABD2K0S7_HETSC
MFKILCLFFLLIVPILTASYKPVCKFPCSIIEHYGQKKCNGCEPSCDNPNPKICTKKKCNCSCECLPGLLRNKKSGKCVKKCPYKAD